MNGFINQIVSRHTNPIENILPRLPGRFETQFQRDHFAREEILPGEINNFREPSNSIDREILSSQNSDQDLKTISSIPKRIINNQGSTINTDSGSGNNSGNTINESSSPLPVSVSNVLPIVPALSSNAINENSDVQTPNTNADTELDHIHPVSHTNNQKGINNSTVSHNTINNFILSGAHQLTNESNIKPTEQSLYSLKNQKTITPRLHIPNYGTETMGTSVIKVSIGRIEVKAISPPNQVKTERSAIQKPKLTLEDYLKRRNRTD